MLSLNSVVLIGILVSAAYARQICYEGYGCFIDTVPFGGTLQRPLAFLPDSPAKIGATFTLYNRKLPNGVPLSALQTSGFDPKLETKIIVHGFFHHGARNYFNEIRQALLTADNLNVIITDWSKGNGLPYTQATANTQIVGAEIAILVNKLLGEFNTTAAKFHCIGHSLGSHICGYAGQRIIGLGKITGLDPAGPYFENTDPLVRLDTTDAVLVEAIHTDGAANLKLGLGLIQSVGHIDYFPNGGKDQPNCPQDSSKLLSAIFGLLTLDVDTIEKETSCSHLAALQFYIDSIKNACKYTAFPCKSQADFESGQCIQCHSSKGCNRMGYYSSGVRDLGDLYLNTQSPVQFPYCRQNYRVTLTSTSALSQARGKFTIFFQTANHISSTEVLDDNASTFKKGAEDVRLISLNTPLDDGDLVNVFISFTKATSLLSSWLYENKWAFDKVQVFCGETQKLFTFCPSIPFIESGHSVMFKRC